MPFVSGELISPNLRLVRKLSEGGMGAVWIADHLTLQTQVAVKFMSPHVAHTTRGQKRFGREAASIAKMKHPHVVQILDYGWTDQGQPFIAMELLEGENLAQRIDRLGRLSLPETSVIISQTCKALTKAHSLGIIHRDIKPENIFLTEVDGELFVKVLDFGAARPTGLDKKGITATGTRVGTARYMSPEQAAGARNLDLRTDLWSVAVAAYECLTGVPPFDGNTEAAVFVAVHQGVYERPSRMVRRMPPAVDEWFAKALSHDPEKRFATARELAEAYGAAIGQSQERQGSAESSAPPVVRVSEPGPPPAPMSASRKHRHLARTVTAIIYRTRDYTRRTMVVVAAVTAAVVIVVGIVALRASRANARNAADGAPQSSTSVYQIAIDSARPASAPLPDVVAAAMPAQQEPTGSAPPPSSTSKPDKPKPRYYGPPGPVALPPPAKTPAGPTPTPLPVGTPKKVGPTNTACSKYGLCQ
jgi:eukaryotic-like serine/threonine-protein kinase